MGKSEKSDPQRSQDMQNFFYHYTFQLIIIIYMIVSPTRLQT